MLFLSDDRLLALDDRLLALLDVTLERDLRLSLDLDFFLCRDLDRLFSLDLDRLLDLDLDLGDLCLELPDPGNLFLSNDSDLLSLTLDSPERDLLPFSLYFAALTSVEASRRAELVPFRSEGSTSADFFPFLEWESLELEELSRLLFASFRFAFIFFLF